MADHHEYCGRIGGPVELSANGICPECGWSEQRQAEREALRWPITPAQMAELESLGFEPGSGNPVAWLVGRAQAGRIARTEADRGAAEVDRLRKLIPAVDPEWQNGYMGGHCRYYTNFVDTDEDPIPALHVFRHIDRWRWTIQNADGKPLLDWRYDLGADTEHEAKAEAEKAARDLGLPV